MGKKEAKSPRKAAPARGKDIRSYLTIMDSASGAAGAGEATKAAATTQAVAAPEAQVPVEKSPAAKPPTQSPSAWGKKKSAASPKQAKQQQQQQPAPKAAAAPPVSKKRSRVVDSEDGEDAIEDDEAVVVAAGRKGAAAKAKGSGGAANGTSSARAAKKRRVVQVDDDDEDDVMAVSSDDDNGDFEDLVESSGDDSDVVMEDSEDEGPPAKGAKGKKAAKGGKQQQQQAGSEAAAKKGGSQATPTAKAAPSGGRKLPGSLAVPTPSATPSAAKDTPSTGKAAASVPKGKSPRDSTAAAAAAPPSAAAKKAKAAAKPAFATDANAAAAIAAVDAAAATLPPPDQVKFSLIPEGADAAGNDSTEPPNYGNKECPRGHPDCLTGKTFVVTGVLDSLMRPDAEDLIRRHGGKVTQSVSGKTTFLLAGHNAGRSKYRTALEKKTKIIDEDGLFKVISASVPFMPKQDEQQQQQQQKSPAPSAAATQAAGRPGPGTVAPSSFFGGGSGGGASGSGAGAAVGGSGRGGAGPTHGSGSGSSQLWVDKYKPRDSSELVGNTNLVKDLRTWLGSWEQVHLRGGAAPAAAGGGAKGRDLGKKAVLLSGPPGIGKTSAAHIISREAGFEVVEMNASDTRNKSGKVSEGMGGKQSNVVKEMANNTTLLGLGAAGRAGAGPRKQLLVMDEVDGMSGGDRGGIQDLIQTIQRSKIPIICICNDKYSTKLRSLRNHCLELEFRKPTAQQISKRMSDICNAEGLNVNQSTMDALVTGAGGDLRLILGQLQMVRLRARSLTYDEVKGRLGTSKDADMSPFDCARRLLEPSSAHLSFGERSELVFADMDLVPLLVQENYVNHRPTIATTPQQRLRALAKAADAISLGTLMPATYMRGSRETFGLYPNEMNFPRFTAWLGNFSSSNKQRRLLGELSTSLAASGHLAGSGRGAVRLEYASALRTLLTKPLAAEGEGGIAPTVELMHDYCIDKEQMEYILDVTSFKSKAPWAEDPYKEVPAKVKAAFTRNLNATAPAPRSNAQVEEVKLRPGAGAKGGKGRKAKAAGGGEDEEELALAGEGAEGEQGGATKEEEEEEEVDAATLARRLAQDGVEVQLQEGAAGKGKKGRGGAAGWGAGAGGRGAAKGGGGRGGGRGKK